MRSLEKVWIRCRAQSNPYPPEILGQQHEGRNSAVGILTAFGKKKQFDDVWIALRLWLQSDNTVKEIRNTYTARVLCTLLQQEVFRVCSECHLLKGHTHEDIDAVFSLCASCLRSASDLQTPRDIQRRIQDKVAHVFESKGMMFSVDLMGEVAASNSVI